jgi:hypothetical protein
VEFLAGRFRKLGWDERKLTAVLLTSAARAATAGLDALVRHAGCSVVAPKAGLEEVRRLCPAGTKLLTEEDLTGAGWFEVEAIPLGGRGVAPLAYRLRWAGKTVLVSGRIPVKAAVPALEELTRDVGRPGGSVADYLKSLERLGRVKPDLWLPAVPIYGQNANLYDRAWAEVLEDNRKTVAW